jgi:RNA polymerase sigma factor (sigma-70 family)
MGSPESTCWTMVTAAAGGDQHARVRFTDIYLDVVRCYLAARWRDRPALRDLDDAVQDVFLECFRSGGALARLSRHGSGAFRTFLYAVVRNVALRHEDRIRAGRQVAFAEAGGVPEPPAGDATPSVAFDRAWARTVLARARDRQRRAAHQEDARRRVELLDLRFGDGLGIKEIAERWEMEPERVHTMYRRARAEFKLALFDELAFHGHADVSAVEGEAMRLLSLLGTDR